MVKDKKEPSDEEKGQQSQQCSKIYGYCFSWLAYIGKLDGIYTNNAIILNRLFTRKHHKLRYLTYPC